MYLLVEYMVSIFIWLLLIGLVVLLMKKIFPDATRWIRFFDFVLIVFFLNAICYLCDIKAIEFVTLKYVRWEKSPYYHIVHGYEIGIVKYFFESIINWILVLVIPLIMAMRLEK